MTDKMICLIRIRGEINLDRDVKETLSRLRIRKKYSCVVIKPTKEQEGMIKKVRNFAAYGKIDKATFESLVEKRGQRVDKKKKLDSKKAVGELEKGKKYDEVGLKPFFRLHPPRGGIDSKVHFPKGKGVLGDHGDKINELVLRML